MAWMLGASAVVAVEAAQIFIRSHAADITDVIFGWLGVALGVRVGIRLFKHTTAAFSEPLGVARGTSLMLTGLWALVVCGYHWQPFDFGIDMALIRSKVSSISLIPFAGYQTGEDLNALNTLITKIAVAGPLGLLASFTVPAGRLLGRVLILSWIALAGLFFAAVEVGQLFVPSRVPDPTDVLLGVAASAAGVWFGRWLRRR
jgi:glycopeptide antibiotics resistance protein